tara:strand:+ start:1066 stop:1239 length:174 start_codon:yes stop_codon:yes gene_type:complete
MFEFKKALWMLLLSTPVLFGINDLADSVRVHNDKALLYLSEKNVHKQAYDTRTDPLY